MSNTFSKYGLNWPVGADPLEIELYCIKNKEGDLSLHCEEARKLIWPHLDSHRWHNLCRDEICRNKVTVLMGAGSTGKTHEASCYGLIRYFADPQNTCVLISSTDVRGLRLRVWGEITHLWQQARERHGWLPGNLIDSRIAITTDNMDEDEFDKNKIRDMRKGIVGIPTVQSGKQVGLGKWSGIKQRNILLIADEAQFMGPSFLSAFANLNNNASFQAIVLGNPSDILDPLGKAAEPREGWTAYMNPEKTTVWKTRFMDGTCVNLVGTDSPNFDQPGTKYPYLISKEKIDATTSFFAKDSVEYFSQCVGTMKVGTMAHRVLSRDLCVQFNTKDGVKWDGSGTTKIGGLDAAYGGDRSVCGHVEFGKCLDGKVRLLIYPPVIVPIKVSLDGNPMDAEEQIARFVKSYCNGEGIAPENFYHDSTGRGSLGTALAREWSASCNPVEFGGSPSKRPVTADTYIIDQDGRKRLKLASEHYVKFVTELWFAVRYAVEADQIRGLPEDVMEEFCMREWRRTNGDKIEVETKRDMKDRVGRSPDFADWCFEGNTLIETTTGQKKICDITKYDMIVTPFGITEVDSLRIRTARSITTVDFSDGSSLSGLGEHKVFTWNEGWKRLDSLSIDNEIESTYNIPIWNILNLLFTKNESTDFKHLADIIKTRTGIAQRDFYIELFGWSIMAISLKVFVCITKMVIGQIAGLKIWNWLKSQNTLAATWLKGGKTLTFQNDLCEAKNLQSSRLLSGTNLKLDESGTRKTQKESGSRKGQEHSLAKSAKINLRQYAFKSQNTAPTNAFKNKQESKVKILIESVLCVARNLLLSNTLRRSIAPVAVHQSQLQKSKQVFNLTLKKYNAYYANGILVQNCSICTEGARRRGFIISKLGSAADTSSNFTWLKDEAKRRDEWHRSKQLVHH